VDDTGAVGIAVNNDGSFSGMPVTVNRQTPLLATATTKYKNRLGISYNITDYINRVEIYKAGVGVLNIEGLKDVYVESAAAATTTTVTVDLKTSCADTNLGDTYGADIVAGDFILNVLTGTAPNYTRTPLAFTEAYTGGHYVLTFASQTSGTILEVKGAASPVWYGHDIKFYEAITPAVITIP